MKASWLTAALLPMLVLASPAEAALVAHGLGEVTFPSCVDTPDDIFVVGDQQGSSWTFVLTDVNANGPCEVVEATVFEGRWNPAIGGCMKSVATAGPATDATAGSLCLRKPHKLSTARYEYDVWSCLPVAGCVTGDILLEFTNVAP